MIDPKIKNLLTNMFSYCSASKIFLYSTIFFLVFVIFMSKVNVSNIKIKNEKNLIDYDKKYPLPKKNLRGRDMIESE
tara:strand:- start:386 stop:616 length:231 start_codon:yes stop_codon:yes gene_type:complete